MRPRWSLMRSFPRLSRRAIMFILALAPMGAPACSDPARVHLWAPDSGAPEDTGDSVAPAPADPEPAPHKQGAPPEGPRVGDEPTITVGPLVGGVEADRAVVLVRLDGPFEPWLELSLDPDFERLVHVTDPQLAVPEHDHTVRFRLEGLAPDTRYHYRVVVEDRPLDAASPRSFRSAPRRPGTFTFGVLADASREDGVDTPAYESLAAQRPAFVLQIGDMDHRNPGASNPRDIVHWRRMHRDQLHDFMQGRQLDIHLLSGTPFVHVWDDHDYYFDDAHGMVPGEALARQAFFEYFPVPRDTPNPAEGIWHSFRWGQAEVFMLDLRSQRAVPVADSPGPTSLLDAYGIPDDQKTWLMQRLASSTAVWKIIVSSSCWNPRGKQTDSWALAQDEQKELVNHIRRLGLTGVFVVSGDLHSGGGIDDGSNAILPELSVPSTNMDEVGCTRGDCGSWSEGIWSGEHPDGFATVTLDFDLATRQHTALLRTWSDKGDLRQSLALRPDEAAPR
jgi:alkaline phosphatase D